MNRRTLLKHTLLTSLMFATASAAPFKPYTKIIEVKISPSIKGLTAYTSISWELHDTANTKTMYWTSINGTHKGNSKSTLDNIFQVYLDTSKRQLKELNDPTNTI